ncbi:CoB--CoM heterodisulfide reductase iron-sulfur subunit B family protein [candidate division KSB1 bacterium]|nr:CoB--CoM heterodisulfide reductase iron-sulfur subunit B family protein [candidate division KSB1 bacterium]
MAMKIAYYPGCTLKTKAKNFEDSALAAASALGVEFEELEMWNCCGTVYSLADDDLIHQIASIRNLIRVRDKGENKVVTLCSMCYNTMKRANLFIQTDELKHRRINTYMDNEKPYNGEVKVYHFLELLRDEIGLDEVRFKTKKPLSGLKVAPYYGCLLVRPPEVGLDDLENPTVIENVFTQMGAEVIDDPLKTECCGSYQTVNMPEFVADLSYKILNSAKSRGADVVVTSCPLCQFNLDRRQRDIIKKRLDFAPIPVMYFTQLMAMAFDLPADVYGLDSHFVDPKPLLRKKGFIELA